MTKSFTVTSPEEDCACTYAEIQ